MQTSETRMAASAGRSYNDTLTPFRETTFQIVRLSGRNACLAPLPPLLPTPGMEANMPSHQPQNDPTWAHLSL
jgi:hypothetical protein